MEALADLGDLVPPFGAFSPLRRRPSLGWPSWAAVTGAKSRTEMKKNGLEIIVAVSLLLHEI